MIKLSFRIYLLANLSVLMFVFGLAMMLVSFSDFEIVLYVSMVSFLFTLSVIPALVLIFWMVGRIKQNIFIKWILFLLLIAICATIPTFMIEFPRLVFSAPLLQFSLPAAFLGVLFQANPIHQYLINSHGKENPE